MPKNRSYSISSRRGHGASDRDHHKHLNKLKAKGPMRWHTSDPALGSKRLAMKNDFIAMLGEYVGTVLFMIFALGGTNVALIPSNSITGDVAGGEQGSTVATVDTSNLLYISLCFGFSLAVNAWIFFRVSGGLFNPAVSLAMALVGALTPKRAALLALSQILGGITGAAIIQAITPGTLNCLTTLGGGTSVVQGLFIEMFLTALLMLAILLLAAEKQQANFIAPIGIGLALFVAELLGVYYTGGSLNPARSFGPAVVIHTFDNYHWIYWLGPAMGASLAAGFYKLLKWLQYETVLGDNDADSKDISGKGDVKGDEEKNIDSSGGAVSKGLSKITGAVDGNWQVSGPGLGDLHTTGEYNDKYELNPGSEQMSQRLDNIEHLLERLAQNQSPRTRHSDLTVFDDDRSEKIPRDADKSDHSERVPRDANRSTSRFSEDLRLNPASEERIRSSVSGNRVEPLPPKHTEHRVAGKPKAELGPRE